MFGWAPSCHLEALPDVTLLCHVWILRSLASYCRYALWGFWALHCQFPALPDLNFQPPFWTLCILSCWCLFNLRFVWVLCFLHIAAQGLTPSLWSLTALTLTLRFHSEVLDALTSYSLYLEQRAST